MHGIWPILYAHFSRAGHLDRQAMRWQVQTAVRSGSPGVAILGLATEVNKLSVQEKHDVIAWTAEDLAGAAPMAVTISGPTAQAQLELAQVALASGAHYLVLQPPPRKEAPITQEELEAFFQLVLDGLAKMSPDTPVGIQNAPEFLGIGLDAVALARLRSRCANLRFLKGEAPAVIIERTVQSVGPQFPVLNGRGGMELIDNLRAGCSGMIVAPDCAFEQGQIADLYSKGEIEQAQAQYERVLPTITFVMQSLETLVVYGKRIAAWRCGMDVHHDRQCALMPSPFGLAAARRFARQLGPLPGCTLHQDAT
jgi:4-hydroxy-tetrahydrodipicolinate synthase